MPFIDWKPRLDTEIQAAEDARKAEILQNGPLPTDDSVLSQVRRHCYSFEINYGLWEVQLKGEVSERTLASFARGESTLQTAKAIIIEKWWTTSTFEEKKKHLTQGFGTSHTPEAILNVLVPMKRAGEVPGQLSKLYKYGLQVYGLDFVKDKWTSALATMRRRVKNLNEAALPDDPAPFQHNPALPGHPPALLDLPVPSPPRSPVVEIPSARTPTLSPLDSERVPTPTTILSSDPAASTLSSPVTASILPLVPIPADRSTTSQSTQSHPLSQFSRPDSGSSLSSSELSCSPTQSPSMSSMESLSSVYTSMKPSHASPDPSTPDSTTPKFSPPPAPDTPKALTSTTTASFSPSAPSTGSEACSTRHLLNPRECESDSEVHDEIRMIEKKLEGLKEERSFIERVGKYGIEHAKRTDPGMVEIMEEDKRTKTIQIDEKISSIVSLLAEKKFQLDRQ